MAYQRLGDILVASKLITEEQLNEALEDGKRTGKRLGQTLIDNDVITEMQMIDALKMQLGVDFVDLMQVKIPVAMASLIPKNLAKKYSMVPIRQQGDTLYLAMEDPLNFRAIEEAKSATRMHVVPMIATAASTQRAINTLYGNEGVSRAIDDLQNSLMDDELDDTDTVTLGEDEAETAPTVRLVDSVVERAIAEKASDIHMEPRADGLAIRMRIDGVLHNILTVPKNLQNSVISRVKVMANLDIAERRIPQDGRANVRINQRDLDLRISTLPTRYGEKVVIRLLEKSAALLSSAGIGLADEHLDLYHDLIHNANGVILIAGPTGSGKSTTMYTMISELNSEAVNLVTLEDPVEYDIDGVNQVQINEKTGLTFAGGLRSILRQDPDIIAVGEIRDGETAEIAMRSAITGHLVLSTIHTNNAVATLDRLVDIGVEPYLIASALKGVIAQRLVRHICPKCREAYIPSVDELREVGLESAAGMPFYRGTGCPDCMETGYRGRTAVFEILVMTAEIKRLLRENRPHEELLAAVRASGFKSMDDHGRRLVLAGETTIEEIERIMHTTDD